MYYTAHDGRQILDGIAGLWAVNAGHCRQPIVEAIKKQAESLDYATGFQMHSPGAFLAADRLVQITPKGMDHVFFVNSGSEAVDTALKIALAYHRVRGEGHAPRADRPRARLPRRGLRRHLRRRHDRQPQDLQRPTAARGRPPARTRTISAQQRLLARPAGARRELADDLERLVALHDASNIAAVIVEPVAGSTGVLHPAEGLPAAPAPDLRQARHPADLRRGHHRLRPHRQRLRRADLRRHART